MLELLILIEFPARNPSMADQQNPPFRCEVCAEGADEHLQRLLPIRCCDRPGASQRIAALCHICYQDYWFRFSAMQPEDNSFQAFMIWLFHDLHAH